MLYYDQGITYCYFKTAVNNKLIGLVDSDFGSDPDTWKSLTDYLMYVNGNTISWRSSQHFFYLLLRFSEVDFVVASQADQAVVHLRDPLKRVWLYSQETHRPGKISCHVLLVYHKVHYQAFLGSLIDLLFELWA